MAKLHDYMEKRSFALMVGILGAVAVGGTVEIAPLFWIDSTIEEVDGVRPYSPLELAGSDIYVREGCYLCHSQMIRPLRDEIERYGHYSLAAESMYDRPFQWGSKRTGPDLARVGGKYTDGWHVIHMSNPRKAVPDSVMPPYAFLAKTKLDYSNVQAHLKTKKALGEPYSDEMIKMAEADIKTQVNPDSDDLDAFMARYPKAQVRNFDGQEEITEMDALIAYLQIIGTMVDFNEFEATIDDNSR